ncbi:MAG: hypothetical protein QW145_05650 [Candidatus Bathyarchaeia archaeon]
MDFYRRFSVFLFDEWGAEWALCPICGEVDLRMRGASVAPESPQ